MLHSFSIIGTVMRMDKPQWWLFNSALFLYQLIMLSVGKLIGKIDASWSEIWHAAQWAHIRLVLMDGAVLSVTAPHAKIESFWSRELIDGSKGHFIYREPVFSFGRLNEIFAYDYAVTLCKNKTARLYDYLQLLSFAINFPLWLIYWPWWGRQIIGIFNLPGGREVCSTGIAALLRYAIFRLIVLYQFATPMICPALFAISKLWRTPDA
jgi:hypothetical protein